MTPSFTNDLFTSEELFNKFMLIFELSKFSYEFKFNNNSKSEINVAK